MIKIVLPTIFLYILCITTTLAGKSRCLTAYNSFNISLKDELRKCKRLNPYLAGSCAISRTHTSCLQIIFNRNPNISELQCLQYRDAALKIYDSQVRSCSNPKEYNSECAINDKRRYCLRSM